MRTGRQHRAYSTIDAGPPHSKTLDLTEEAGVTLTEIAAWWGATIATVVFLWDIYKWRQSGARLRLTVSGNMEAYGHLAILLRPDQILIVAEVVNIGSKRTTITHMFAYYYESWWRRLLRLRSQTLTVMPDPALAQPLPFELDPGARWLGATYQNQQVEEMSTNGYLFIGILHSVSRAPIFQRLVIPKIRE